MPAQTGLDWNPKIEIDCFIDIDLHQFRMIYCRKRGPYSSNHTISTQKIKLNLLK